MTTTTIRIDYSALPEGFDLSRPDAIAEVIEQALRESGIPAEASDVLSHLKIELPTAQLGAAALALAELRLIRPERSESTDIAPICLRTPARQGDGVGTGTMQLTEGYPAMTTRRAAQNNKALDAFIAAKAEIDTMLERLKVLSDDHFETHPDEINWGHVGTLKHYARLLRQITDSAFEEGEHAT